MLVTMSDKELSRINVIQSVVEKRMRRRDAAHQLALTERQTQRLMNRFSESYGDIRMLVTMSDKELSRINVIQSVVEKRMRRRDAAHQLALTERQTQRLMNRFSESGAAGLANLRRGSPGNHRLPESLKLRVLSLLHDHYSDFGPTLAAEKIDGSPHDWFEGLHDGHPRIS